jgi:hypothetical protein
MTTETATRSVGGGRSVRLAFSPKPARAEALPVGRIPRVARLMALAIRLDGMLKDGVVSHQAELATIGLVTRARLTQILNLGHLAPDLQEQILHFPPVLTGRDPISEPDLRPIAALVSWDEQRSAWQNLLSRSRLPQESMCKG